MSDQHVVAQAEMTTRRSFMVGTSAVAAATVLAGCTAGQGEGPRRGSGAESGDVVGAVNLVPVGGGRIFPNAGVVVTQPTEGEYVGLSAICSHQHCTLREVSKEKIFCGCHGSEFDLHGNVLLGPATENLELMPVRVEGDSFILE